MMEGIYQQVSLNFMMMTKQEELWMAVKNKNHNIKTKKQKPFKTMLSPQ